MVCDFLDESNGYYRVTLYYSAPMQKSLIMTESLAAKLRSRPNKQNIRANVSEFHRKSFDRQSCVLLLTCVYRNKTDYITV